MPKQPDTECTGIDCKGHGEEITWQPVCIKIEQRGWGLWYWSVEIKRGVTWFSGSTGSCMTKRAAIRRSKRYREGYLNA